MPLYEYTCDDCRSDFEALVRGSEKPACPDCGSGDLTKRFSVPAAHSGSGGLKMADDPGMCGRPECGMGGCQGLG